MSTHDGGDDLVQEVSLGQSPVASTADYFRMTQNEKRRIGLVWTREDRSLRMLSAPAVYIDGVGKVVSRLGRDGPEADELWSQGEAARTSYATLVMTYPRGPDKNLDRARVLAAPGIMRWTFSERTFTSLQKVAAGSSGGVDLLATCTDERYQRIEFQRFKDCLWWDDEELREAIQNRVTELESSVSPARRLSTEELAAKLGRQWPPQPEVTEADFIDDVDAPI